MDVEREGKAENKGTGKAAKIEEEEEDEGGDDLAEIEALILEEKWTKLTMADLKLYLKSKKLSCEGNKQALIERVTGAKKVKI